MAELSEMDSLKRDIHSLFDEVHWTINFDLVCKEDETELCRVLMGVIAIKFKVLLHLMDDVTTGIQEILHQCNKTSTQNQELTVEDLDNEQETKPSVRRPFLLTSYVDTVKSLSSSENFDSEALLEFSEIGFLPATEEFMLGIQQISTFSAINLPNKYLNLYNCIQATNLLLIALKQNSPGKLQRVSRFLSLPLASHSTYCWGNVHVKESHTYVVESSIGPIQVGIPAETIKHSMLKGEDVPQVYVLPPQLFDATGANFGEVEFPIYFNFFIKKAFLDPENKIIIVGEQAHLDRVIAVFKESFYGPEEVFVDEEIAPDKKAAGYTINLTKERETIANKGVDGKPTPLTDFGAFLPFDESGEVKFVRKINKEGQVREVEIRIFNHSGFLRFYEDGVHTGSVDTGESAHAHRCVTKEHDHEHHQESGCSEAAFVPPTFGITFLGTSHGFDSKGNTTGFIIWLNGRGILVDPPANTSAYLREHGVKFSFVNKVILTHCHSDHDSGTLRMIIGGERIDLFTTKTINESYKKKMNAITGLNIADFYDFIPVPIGKPIQILGGSFEFDYSFHTIPTIRFKWSFAGRSMSYSSDTYYNPEFYAKLVMEKVISPERALSLNTFLFDTDLVIHESGIPPIHTAISVLNDLPLSLKKKMCVVHCASIPPTVQKVLPDGTEITVPVKHLRIPASGIENTIVLDVGQYMEGYAHATRRLKMFSEIFLFRNLPPNLLYELFFQCEEQTVAPGEFIIRSGEQSDQFYIVEAGIVDIYAGKDRTSPLKATLGSGDIFGENALRNTEQVPRSASVVARTACKLLAIYSHTFKNIVGKSHVKSDILSASYIELDISRMAKMRPFVAEVLSHTYLFQNLTVDQVNFIAALLDTEITFTKDAYIIREGGLDCSLFVIERGSVRLERSTEDGGVKEIMRLGVGDIFGELSLLTGLPRSCSVVANEDSVLLELTREKFDRLINNYQNLRVKLAVLVEQRLRENVKVGNELTRASSFKLISPSALRNSTNETEH